jgi:hypothetical protein
MNHQRGRAKRHAPPVVTATRGLLKRPICVVWRRRPGVPAVPGRRLYRAQLDRLAASFSFFVYDLGRLRCGRARTASASGRRTSPAWRRSRRGCCGARTCSCRTTSGFRCISRTRDRHLQPAAHPAARSVRLRATDPSERQLGRLDGPLRRSPVMREGDTVPGPYADARRETAPPVLAGRWDNLRAHFERRLRAATSPASFATCVAETADPGSRIPGSSAVAIAKTSRVSVSVE